MPEKNKNVRREKREPTCAVDKTTPKRRDEGWDERLRRVGDARFVEVQWSGRDDPSWPLPKK